MNKAKVLSAALWAVEDALNDETMPFHPGINRALVLIDEVPEEAWED